MKKSDVAYVMYALLLSGVCGYCSRWCFKKAEYYRSKAKSNKKA